DGAVLDIPPLTLDAVPPNGTSLALACSPPACLAVWQDYSTNSLHAVHFTPGDAGSVATVALPALQGSLALGASPTGYLLAASSGPMSAIRLDTAGVPIDPAPISIGQGVGQPVVGFDGTDWLVAWQSG